MVGLLAASNWFRWITYGGLILALSGSGVVLAGSQEPVVSGSQFYNKDDPRAQIYGDPNFKTPTHSAHYGKANQNLTVQIDYVDKKLEFLNETVDPQASDRDDQLRRKFKLLGGFCGPIPAGPISDDQEDELDQCINQYSLLMQFWKKKALGSIGRNNDSKAQLQCKNIDSSGFCTSSSEGVWVAPETTPDDQKREQMPAYATAQQLAKFAEDKGLNRVTDNQGQDWEKYLYESLAPQEDDFLKYEAAIVQGAQIELSSRQVSKLKTGSTSTQGKSIDQNEYQAAQTLWNLLKGRVSARFKGKLPPKNLAQIRKDFVSEFRNKVLPGQRSDARRLYDQARGENIDYTNSAYGLTVSRIKQQPKPSSSPVAKGGSGKPQIEKYTLTLTPPPDPIHGYLGDEQIKIPQTGNATQGVGENSVTYNPSAGNTLFQDLVKPLQRGGVGSVPTGTGGASSRQTSVSQPASGAGTNPGNSLQNVQDNPTPSADPLGTAP